MSASNAHPFVATVREMKTSDYDAVTAVEDILFPFRYEVDKQIAAVEGLKLPDRRDLFEAILHDRRRSMAANFVALDSLGVVVGYANGRPHIAGRQTSRDSYMLTQVAVVDDFRHAGIGRSLVAAVSRHAESRGFFRMISSIPDVLSPWYEEKLGWVVLPPGSSFWWIDRAGMEGIQAPSLTGEYPGPVEHGYTSFAWTSLGTESPYLTFAVAKGRNVNARLVDLVASDRSLLAKLPRSIAELVSHEIERRNANRGQSFFRS